MLLHSIGTIIIFIYRIVDVTNFDSVPLLVEQITNIVGDKGLNLVINNAGIFTHAGFEDTSHETMIEHYKVLVAGPFALVKVSRYYSSTLGTEI